MLSHRLKTFAEIAAVFAVFFLFGSWMVPDVNEAHYIGKAIHYWNPDWIPDDPFLESKDSHWTFYLAFGWLTFFCSPTAMAWIGRCVAWGLMAWSWQRLSFALIPVRWAAIPTALALAYYIESFNMAGEWLIGGIEGKSLAYPFVFFALEAILHNRWNRAGIFLGIACAFHILVGGWVAIIAAGMFFLRLLTHDVSILPPASCRPNVPWLGITLGGLLALCGLVPVLMLNAGTSAAVTNEANQIYVFLRLQHHLVPYMMKDSLVLRFTLLTLIWILLCRHSGERQRTFNNFIWGTLVLSAIGMILAYSLPRVPQNFNPSEEFMWSAEILRFYWFRLADIAVPMGVAIGGMRWVVEAMDSRWQMSVAGLQKSGGRSQQNDTSDETASTVGGSLLPSAISLLQPVALIIAVYFTTTYLCFGYFKITPPDQGIPWAITLLICWGVLLFRRLPSIAVCRLLLYIAIAFYAPLTALPKYADLRTHSGQCRAEAVGPNGKRAGKEWQDMCQWIRENTPRTAKFWVPRNEQTFKWYAERSDIGTWKNIPQDAESIVRWYHAVGKKNNELYFYKDAEKGDMEDRLITTLVNSKTEEEITVLRQKYGFEYILCAQSYEMPSQANLENVYENDVYRLYRVLP